MRKLLLLFVILLLGFTLASCDDGDGSPYDSSTPTESTTLVSDLIDNIKGVFGD